MSVSVASPQQDSPPRLVSLWLILLIVTGTIASYVDRGLQSRTLPTGICFSLNTLSGASLAAGGFLLALVVFFTVGKTLAPVIQASLLIAVLGHVIAILGALAETQGSALTILFHSWSLSGFLAGAGWSLLIYTLAIVSELVGNKSLTGRMLKRSQLPVLLVSASLACIHLFSATRSLMLVQGAYSPLWVGPLLPVLILVSSIAATFGLILLAVVLTANTRIVVWEVKPWMSQILGCMLLVYLSVRIAEIAGQPRVFEVGVRELILFIVEMGLLLTALYFSQTFPHGTATRSPYIVSALTVAWFLTNRLNTGITTLEVANRTTYYPRWTEIAVAYSIAAMGIVGFAYLVRFFPALSSRRSGS